MVFILLLNVLLSVIVLHGSSFAMTVFHPGNPAMLQNKVCFNIGSKQETIGQYSPETAAFIYPNTAPPIKELFIKQNFAERRAFQLVRTHSSAMNFFALVEPRYRYNVQLGFIDVGKTCKTGGSSMTITVGDAPTKKRVNPTKDGKCSRPYFVSFTKVNPDSKDRIKFSINGNPLSNLATICIQKDLRALPQTKGSLFLDADDSAEVYLNGKSIMKVSECSTTKKVDVSLKLGDVISAKAVNFGGNAGLRVAFFSEGNKRFETDASWKVRNEFPVIGKSLSWTLPTYIDDDWPTAKFVNVVCAGNKFPTDTNRIWINEGEAVGTVFFRYTVTL